MKKILFAWIGEKDLDAAKAGGAIGLGAVCQTITDRQFDEIVLLSNHKEEDTANYMHWLEQRNIKNVYSVKADLGGNPTDYRAIYESAKLHVQDYLNRSSKQAQLELAFLITGGTPAMQTIWIMLANSLFSAKLIKSSIERGVEDVDFPFKLFAADYLPVLLKESGNKISELFNDSKTLPTGFKEFIGKSSAVKHLIHRASLIAPHPVPVLIQGESGTGKELLANAIHVTSRRKGEKPVAINCGAIQPELFESELFGHKKDAFTGATKDKAGFIEEAAGGTLFLDEIGEMPKKIQVKLLRVLQDGSYNRVGDSTVRYSDVRIISATNRDLLDEIAKGTFREDLYHRLAVATLYIPPLREREGDIDLLVNHLLDIANKKLAANSAYKAKTISKAARHLLLKHPWPGNVRELENTLLRAAVWSQHDVIDKQAIEDAMLPIPRNTASNDAILNRQLEDGFDLEEVIAEVVRHYVERAMVTSGGNKTNAAKLLNFKSYQRLDKWLEKYNIS